MISLNQNLSVLLYEKEKILNSILHYQISKHHNYDLLIVENDRKINLYRIHSSKSFSKENAKKVCEKFINNSYNCILFKI